MREIFAAAVQSRQFEDPCTGISTKACRAPLRIPKPVISPRLGGIRAPVVSANVANSVWGQSAAVYRTAQGTYFVFRNGSASVSAYKILSTNPPTIVPAWTVNQNGEGSPRVTTTDGQSNAIVWVAGAGGDQRLHAYNGDTDAVIYAGGGANELVTGTRKWNTGIVARGRIYFAADNKVYAFKVP
jgi:hypothetical protein